MGLDIETILGIVFLTLLAILLTGPGMWSEKWGWSVLRGRKRRPPRSGGDRAASPRH